MFGPEKLKEIQFKIGTFRSEEFHSKVNCYTNLCRNYPKNKFIRRWSLSSVRNQIEQSFSTLINSHNLPNTGIKLY